MILKDGKINTNLIKPGDFIQFYNGHSKKNGIIIGVLESYIISHVKTEKSEVESIMTSAIDIKKGVSKFAISSELSGGIRVNLPSEGIDPAFINSLDWNDSKEDRVGWP